MSKTSWLAYNDLAWTDSIIAPPEVFEEETERYCRAIRENSTFEVKTLLHLGCGAGGHDYTFKRHFRVTGVDISPGMLDIARTVNPEAVYLDGDMRTVRLPDRFDAVVVPDSIGYMTTIEDLRMAIHTANEHLNSGGVLLITAHGREEFKENNFVYTGSRGETHITIFENNFISDPGGSKYEATLVYLIRQKGRLEIHTDRHTIGLFERETWLGLFREFGLTVKRIPLTNTYDQYLLGDGEYLQSMFICSKP